MYVDDLNTEFCLENNYPIFEKNEDYFNINAFNRHFPIENLNNNSFSSDNSDLFQKESEINNIENISTNLNTNNLIQSNISMEVILRKKRGRKKKGDLSKSENDKYRTDNEMNKFKTRFYQIYLIEISNKLIEKYIPEEEKKFQKIDSKIIKNLNIKKNLKLLNSPLKDFLSFNISNKNKNKLGVDNNKNLVKKYLNHNLYFNVLFETKIDDLYKIFINDKCVNMNKKLFTIESELSLNYFLNKIVDKPYKEDLEKKWKDIYSFFNPNKRIKNNDEEFY